MAEDSVVTANDLRESGGKGWILNTRHQGPQVKRSEEQRYGELTASGIKGETKTPEQARQEKAERRQEDEKRIARDKVIEAEKQEQSRRQIQSDRGGGSSSSALGGLGDGGRI